MKIGFFTDSYLPSPDGVATSVESSAQELQKLGHEVYIIAPDQPHSKERRNIYRVLSVKIVKSPEVWWALQVPQPSLFKIAKLEFDIIHGHSGGPVSFLGWQLAQLHDLPFVETYHTLWKYYRHYFIYPKLIKHWMVKKFIGFVGNDSDALIAPSVKAKNDLLADGVKKPVYIIPNGIYTESFEDQQKGFLHKTYNIPENKKILLTAGRLHKEKSIDFLISSFAKAKKAVPDLVFVIVGTGQLLEKLQYLTASLELTEDVIFTGKVKYTDMPKVYADSDIFLFASRTETQGMVVIEALASGVPVIAVNDSAFENVIENGKNGYLVTKETKSFADKIKLMFGDPELRKKLNNNAKQSAKQFSVNYTTRVLEQVYKEIIYTYELEKNEEKIKRKSFNKQILSLMGISKELSHDYKNLTELLERLKK